MVVGTAKLGITISWGAFLIWLFYQLNVFSIGWAFLPFCAALLISGWVIGFLSGTALVYFGQRFQALAWMTAYAFMPFSAVFYPLSTLPSWAQWIGKMLPMTYVFEGMRLVLKEGAFSAQMFWMSIGLNLVYFLVVLGLFKWLFEKSREKGLSRLE